MAKIYINNSGYAEVTKVGIKNSGSWIKNTISVIYQKINGVWRNDTFNSGITNYTFGGFIETTPDEDVTGLTLTIAGPSSVTSTTCQYVALVNNTQVSVSDWSITSGTGYASINNSGLLTILNGANNSTVSISCSYNGLTANKEITVTYKSGSSSQTTTTTDESGNTVVTTVTDNTDGSSSSMAIKYDVEGNEIGHISENTDTSGNVSTQTVEVNENGDEVVTSYSIDTTNNPNSKMVIDDSVDTGFIPFDGSSDWELTFKFSYDWNRNTGSGNTIVTILSCGEYNPALVSGFLIRFEGKKRSSSVTTPKTMTFLNISQNNASSTIYLYISSTSGRVYTNPMTFLVHITKIGQTITYEMTAVGTLKYNKTKDNATTNVTTTTNEKITHTWTDDSTSTVDITIGGYLSSSGSIEQKADIDVIEFDVHKI